MTINSKLLPVHSNASLLSTGHYSEFTVSSRIYFSTYKYSTTFMIYISTYHNHQVSNQLVSIIILLHILQTPTACITSCDDTFSVLKKKTVKNFYLAVYLYLSFHIFVQLSQQVSFLFLIMWHKNLQLSLIRCLSVLAPLKYFSIIILAGPRNFSTIFVTSHLWSLKRLF